MSESVSEGKPKLCSCFVAKVDASTQTPRCFASNLLADVPMAETEHPADVAADHVVSTTATEQVSSQPASAGQEKNIKDMPSTEIEGRAVDEPDHTEELPSEHQQSLSANAIQQTDNETKPPVAEKDQQIQGESESEPEPVLDGEFDYDFQKYVSPNDDDFYMETFGYCQAVQKSSKKKSERKPWTPTANREHGQRSSTATGYDLNLVDPRSLRDHNPWGESVTNAPQQPTANDGVPKEISTAAFDDGTNFEDIRGGMANISIGPRDECKQISATAQQKSSPAEDGDREEGSSAPAGNYPSFTGRTSLRGRLRPYRGRLITSGGDSWGNSIANPDGANAQQQVPASDDGHQAHDAADTTEQVVPTSTQERREHTNTENFNAGSEDRSNKKTLEPAQLDVPVLIPMYERREDTDYEVVIEEVLGNDEYIIRIAEEVPAYHALQNALRDFYNARRRFDLEWSGTVKVTPGISYVLLGASANVQPHRVLVQSVNRAERTADVVLIDRAVTQSVAIAELAHLDQRFAGQRGSAFRVLDVLLVKEYPRDTHCVMRISAQDRDLLAVELHPMPNN